MTLAKYRKTIVAVIGAVVTIAGIFGTDLDPELVASVTTLLTALGVWFFPNVPLAYAPDPVSVNAADADPGRPVESVPPVAQKGAKKK